MLAPDQLTVAIVAYNAAATIRDTLGSLERQTVTGFPVLVVDSSDDPTAELVRREFPQVRLHHVEERMFPGAARNLALALSETPVIAFVDADCLAAPDWVERILEEQARDGLIVGGSIGAANPASTIGWAYLFCEFSGWLKAGEPRTVRDLATCCFSMKREAFDRFGPFPQQGYCSDTVFCWRAADAGKPPRFVPAIAVLHQNPTSLGAIVSKQHGHGRRFARIRAREKKWGALHCGLRALTAPLLPAYLWLRTALRVAAAPGHRLPFLRATPALLLVLTAWSAGEARSYAHAAFASAAPGLGERRSDGGV